MARTCLPPAKRAILRPIQLGLRLSTPAAQALLEREVGVGRPLVRNPLARLNPVEPLRPLRRWGPNSTVLDGQECAPGGGEPADQVPARIVLVILQSDSARRHGAEDFAQGSPRRTDALLQLHPARFIQHAIAARTISPIQSDGQLLLRKFLLCFFAAVLTFPAHFAPVPPSQAARHQNPASVPLRCWRKIPLTLIRNF